MKEIIETFRSLVTEFGLSTSILLMVSVGEAVLLRYVYLEWRKDVTSFTEAAKGMDTASKRISDAVAVLSQSIAEVRGALFASRKSGE